MSLDVVGFSGSYGSAPVLTNLSLTVGDGEPVALLGRNGSGKTTLLRGLMGMLPKASGRVLLGDRDISTMPTHRRARSGIAYVPQGRDIFPGLSVEENLRLGHTLAGRSMRTPLPDNIFDQFPWMRERLADLGGNLSGGQQQMLAIARVLVAEPKVVLLDEPTEGLAPAVIEDLATHLASIVRERHLELLLVEQNIAFALAIAARGYIMEKGGIVWAGTAEQIDTDDVVNTYLTI